MSAQTCIPDDVLRALHLGTISNADAAPWEAHLPSCPQCLERTRNLHKAETVAVARAVDGAAGIELRDDPEPISPAVESLIRQLVDRAHLEAVATQSLAATAVETPTVRPEHDLATAPQSATLASPAANVSVGKQFGPYRILAQLGEGGMGAVYKATHIKLDKVVALKVLSPQVTFKRMPSDAVTRFEREMRAVGKLNHPHIVQAHDAGELHGTHYLAMEFVDGADLQKLVKDRGPLSVVNACEAIRQSALALAAAHAAGLVHRDIKPSNLLMGKNGQIKVLDLGLALLSEDTHASADLTTAGQSFGTPDYMAPEQWEDAHAADARTDLYALGCTLYFLLVGHPPFGTSRYRTAVAKMKGHVTAAIPDLKAERADVPDGVIAIYRKLLAKSPADRPATPLHVAEFLAPFAASADLSALAMPTLTSPAPTRPKSVSTTSNTARAVQAEMFHTDCSPSATAAAPSPPRRRTLWIGVTAGCAALVLLLAVVLVSIQTMDGNFMIETDDPAFRFQVTAAGDVLLEDTETKTQHRLKVVRRDGSRQEYEVAVVDPIAGLEFRAPTFTLHRGNKAALKAWFERTPETAAEPVLNTAPAPEIAQSEGDDTPDAARERAAAAWVLSIGGQVTATTPQGETLGLTAFPLPDVPFAVTTVNLSNNPRVTDEGLQKLRPLKRIQSLRLLSNPQLTDTALENINTLRSLTEFNSSYLSLTDEAWPHLGKLTSLTSLHLRWSRQLRGRNVAALRELTQLQSLDVGATGFDDEALANLPALPALTRLQLYSTSVTADGVQHLPSKTPALQVIDLRNTPAEGAAVFPALRQFPVLHTLAWTGDRLTPEVTEGLATMPGLRALEITDRLPAAGIRLNNIPQLKSVWWSHIAGADVAEKDWPMWQAPQVEEVYLDWGSVLGDGIRGFLKPFPNVRRIEFGRIPQFAAEDAAFLTGLRDLKTLALTFGCEAVHPFVSRLRRERPDVVINGPGLPPAEPQAP